MSIIIIEFENKVTYNFVLDNYFVSKRKIYNMDSHSLNSVSSYIQSLIDEDMNHPNDRYDDYISNNKDNDDDENDDSNNDDNNDNGNHSDETNNEEESDCIEVRVRKK